uniref:Putative secreted peptide n=1 Tax=Anopheles braziliensis TaxID=58242 RepID=A0A2M3ZQM9_9DIPT
MMAMLVSAGAGLADVSASPAAPRQSRRARRAGRENGDTGRCGLVRGRADSSRGYNDRSLPSAAVRCPPVLVVAVPELPRVCLGSGYKVRCVPQMADEKEE